MGIYLTSYCVSGTMTSAILPERPPVSLEQPRFQEPAARGGACAETPLLILPKVLARILIGIRKT